MNKKTELENGEEVVSKKIVEQNTRLTCGIIMPIATMSAEYTSDHWSDVRYILHKAIEKAGFIPRIVSDSEESTVIHGSIINNIYNDAIVVCDVSNKNANVMFELGMRLAFNKPVVIVKDDKTDYSFDTGNIQHEPYRKDLRHSTVEKFIDDLSRKITKTYEASTKEDYQSFLSYFGKFEIARVENTPIAEGEAIEKLLNKMSSLEYNVKLLHNYNEDKKEDILPSSAVSKYRVGNSDSIEILHSMKVVENVNRVFNEVIARFPEIESIKYENKRFYVYFKKPISIKERKLYASQIYEIIEEWDLPF